MGDTRTIVGPITDFALQVSFGDSTDRIGRLLWERKQLAETWVDLHRAEDIGRKLAWPVSEAQPTSIVDALNSGWLLLGGFKDHVPDGKTV